MVLTLTTSFRLNPGLRIGFSGLNKIGVLSAFGAALVYAIYMLLSNRLIEEVSPIITSTFIYVCFFSLFAGVATDSISF